MNASKIMVTFRTQTGHEVTEVMDRAKGSTQDYNLRASALGWTVVKVESEIDREVKIICCEHAGCDATTTDVSDDYDDWDHGHDYSVERYPGPSFCPKHHIRRGY